MSDLLKAKRGGPVKWGRSRGMCLICQRTERAETGKRGSAIISRKVRWTFEVQCDKHMTYWRTDRQVLDIGGGG